MKDFATILEHNEGFVNVGGNFDEQIDQHASDFHDYFLDSILKIVETCLDKSVWDVCGHHVAFLVSIDGRGDEDAFGRGRGTGGFLLGKVRSGLGTLVDTTAFDSAVFLFAKKHKFGKVNGRKAVMMVELIELINGSLVVAFIEFLSAFLEDELLGERSAVAANAVIDIKNQLCKDRG